MNLKRLFCSLKIDLQHWCQSFLVYKIFCIKTKHACSKTGFNLPIKIVHFLPVNSTWVEVYSSQHYFRRSSFLSHLDIDRLIDWLIFIFCTDCTRKKFVTESLTYTQSFIEQICFILFPYRKTQNRCFANFFQATQKKH